MPCDTPGKRSDILSRPLLSFLIYCLPVIAIVVSGYEQVSRAWRTGIWTAALTVMGVACVANAIRCGRIHCYITGPFFLMVAIGTLLYGTGVISLGTNGWNVIGLTILIGAIVLCCLPEALFGKYRRS
jgi:hypothetical protein